jgi:lactate dehydrogenase-like 2-hydroxyacid dehydrogenase
MTHDILVAYPTLPDQMEQLQATYRLHRLDLADDKAAFLAAFGPRCEGVVTNGHVTIDDAVLAHMPKVRIIASSSVGYDMIDVAALTRHGVTLTNTPDVLTDDVADVAIMLLLAAWRGLVIGDAHVRTGAWGRTGPLPLMRSTAGKRAGIVGLGRIGRAIATRCAALGLEIGYSGRNQKPETGYAYFRDPVALATWADILIVATTGGPETQALIGAEAIAALGPEGTLINIARGTVIDETAMIAALQSGALGQAGLDVFLNEPVPNPAFAELRNVVMYPHHASGTIETRSAMSQLVVDNLAAYFAGKPLLTPVN